MKKSILTLEVLTSNGAATEFRTIIKTQHGRVLFLSLEIQGNICTITNCFYLDRNQGRAGIERYRSKPLKLQTLCFPKEDLLLVIETELDKKFYGVELTQDDNASFSLEEYLRIKTACVNNKYHFLIMVGVGESYNELPVRLRTRLKNKLHRSIYVELEYYKDGNGVVKQCHYYDRKYRRQNIQVTPPMLTSCFFPYSKKDILNLLNHEICCDFTHMIVTDEIDLESNMMPLCGAL